MTKLTFLHALKFAYGNLALIKETKNIASINQEANVSSFIKFFTWKLSLYR